MRARIRLTIVLLLTFGSSAPVFAAGESLDRRLDAGRQARKDEGDLKEAIQVYREILREAEKERPLIAEALLRLGVCLRDAGQPDEARASFERLIERYPDQTDHVEKAREGLLGLIDLQPVPWKDDERLEFRVSSLGGRELGVVYVTAERESSGRRDVWRLETRLWLTAGDIQRFTRVLARTEDFHALRSRVSTRAGDYRVEHAGAEARLEVRADGETSSRWVDAAAAPFDYEQLLFLVRRLPLRKRYAATFPLFSGVRGAVVECRLEVEDTEWTRVPAGRFDCARVKCRIGEGGGRPEETFIWVATDEARTLVKWVSGATRMELAGRGDVSREAASHFRNDKLDVRLQAPPGWLFYANPPQAGFRYSIQMLSPDLSIWSALYAALPISKNAPLANVAASDVRVLQTVLAGYEPRPDSAAPLEIDGKPGLAYVADYREGEEAMVEYRAYLVGDDAFYRFIFRLPARDFDMSRRELESIVRNFEPK